MNDTTELLHVSEMQREDDEMKELSRTVSGELTVDELVGQIELVQEAMRRAMTDGEHYGVIPGTQKPTLLKPGAEKLCLLFRLAPTYDITRRELEGGHVEYEIVCTLNHIPTGQFAGQGVGLCTTMETRYRYRKGSHACPHCGESSIIKGKEEYGGGWLCWKKKDGCGAKFPDEAFDLADLKQVENPDLADVYNTVLKIGKKRAHVDATLTATAASDIFTQDMEESVPFVGTTPSPSTLKGGESADRPFDQPGDVEPVVDDPSPASDTARPDDPIDVAGRLIGAADAATSFWEEVKARGVARSWALQVLGKAGGDFAVATEALRNQTEEKTDDK